MPELLDIVRQGQLDPSFVVTHRLPLSQAPYAYEIFREKPDGCIKVVLDPAAQRRVEIGCSRKDTSMIGRVVGHPPSSELVQLRPSEPRAAATPRIFIERESSGRWAATLHESGLTSVIAREASYWGAVASVWLKTFRRDAATNLEEQTLLSGETMASDELHVTGQRREGNAE